MSRIDLFNFETIRTYSRLGRSTQIREEPTRTSPEIHVRYCRARRASGFGARFPQRRSGRLHLHAGLNRPHHARTALQSGHENLYGRRKWREPELDITAQRITSGGTISDALDVFSELPKTARKMGHYSTQLVAVALGRQPTILR